MKIDKDLFCEALNLAQMYADNNSTCTKTSVGCVIIKYDTEYHNGVLLGIGANSGEENCKELGCLRVSMYGDNSKSHRSTCRCKHSEINALACAESQHRSVKGAMAFVTRYPCINCAKALTRAGIKKVVYGRQFPIEEETKQWFDSHGVDYYHMKDWATDTVIRDTNN